MKERELFLQHLGQTSDFPLMLEIQKAKGVYLYGPEKQKYLDLIAGIGVSNIGHCHAKVVEAVQKQVETYMHLMVYGEYVQTPQVKFATALSDTLPYSLSNCYLVNSGSEATEGALKLAKRYTGRKKIISCINAYHGSTIGALSITGNDDLKNNFRPLLPHIQHIPFNNVLSLEQIDEDTACFIMEPVQGEAGVVPATQEFIETARKKCSETGTLLIFDEVQCGAGRTGKMWAFEHFNVVPDIITCAKGIGGGMPIGAFVSSQEIMGVLKNDPILGHITTFGGHPVSAAAAAACIEVITQEELLKDVTSKATYIRERLTHPLIREIRNLGLMMAVSFDNFEQLKHIIDRCIENGVITDWFLFNDHSMRIAPPLNITFQEIDHACNIINAVLDETS